MTTIEYASGSYSAVAPKLSKAKVKSSGEKMMYLVPNWKVPSIR
jgi:hypothetical protein